VTTLTDKTRKISDGDSDDPLNNVTSSSGSVPTPFTFGDAREDSHTGFYYTGSGYNDRATGQSFSCQDRAPPGQDQCIEAAGLDVKTAG
jgi:hypothetical protein